MRDNALHYSHSRVHCIGAGLNTGIMLGSLVGGIVLEAVRLLDAECGSPFDTDVFLTDSTSSRSDSLDASLSPESPTFHMVCIDMWVEVWRFYRPSFYSGDRLHLRVARRGAVYA